MASSVQLTVASFNCKNFQGILKARFTGELFDKCDFICLQEHWLFESQFHRFSEVLENETVLYQARSAMDPTIVRQGRPHGGTAILWKSDICLQVKPVDTVSSRISCVEIVLSDGAALLLFSVYMPTDERCLGSNFYVFQDVLSEISVICQNNETQNVIICGDFNVDFSRNSPQVAELLEFCAQEHIIPCLESSYSSVNYTFENSSGARSTIDHCLVSQNLFQDLKSYNDYSSIHNESDHICIISKFKIQCDYLKKKSVKKNTVCAWYKATLHDIVRYKTLLDEAICEMSIPYEALECVNPRCTKHRDDLELFHNELIVNVCLSVSGKVLPLSGKGGNKKKCIPGWNKFVSSKMDDALWHHHKWKAEGRPSCGPVYEARKNSRKVYHSAVKMVQKSEYMLRSQCMAEAIANGKHRSLWSEAKRFKGRSKKVPNIIDGVSGSENICNLFANKFENVYNCVGITNDQVDVINTALHNMIDVQEDFILFTYDDFKKAMKKVSLNKSDGNLGLFSDHIVHGTEKLWQLLTMLFNSMLIHRMSPSDMLKGVMIPIPKNRKSVVTNSDNFRAICLQSVLCKILDLMMCICEHDKLNTSRLQFGFKDGVSASLAAAVVTETVDYYIGKGGVVYSLALDASKAFDRVNIFKLFNKLIERKMNVLHLRLLFDMYINQKLSIAFNGDRSRWFSASNGVKQGGVFSPLLFSIYVDCLIERLEKENLGCNIAGMFCGTVAYADDVILLAPTLFALRRMITICEDFAKEHDVIFNGSKSQLIVFGDNVCPNVYVNNQIVKVVTEIDYLGHKISKDRSNNLVKHIVNDFNIKFNSFMGDFQCITSEVKNSLFKQYCCSFYGFQNCAFYAKESERLFTAVRKAQRRVWGLPNMCHRRYLPIITGLLSAENMFHKRFVKFFVTGLKHKNDLVSHIFKNSLNISSRMGNNFRFIIQKYKLSLYDVKSNNIGNLMSVFHSTPNEEDVRICSQIHELINMRDDLNESILNKQEIQCIIDDLSCS